MASIIRSVSLTPQTAHIASKLGNFSAFVREALLRFEAAQGEAGHTHAPSDRLEGLCNAMREPACRVCFPHGAPTREDWLFFTSAPERVGAPWLQERAKKHGAEMGADWAFIAESVAYREPQPEDVEPEKPRPWWRRFL